MFPLSNPFSSASNSSNNLTSILTCPFLPWKLFSRKSLAKIEVLSVHSGVLVERSFHNKLIKRADIKLSTRNKNSTNNFLCVFSKCSQQIHSKLRYWVFHNNWRPKERLGTLKSFSQQIQQIVRQQIQNVFQQIARRQKEEQIKGCRRPCSENTYPPPCADPGGFQTVKNYIYKFK